MLKIKYKIWIGLIALSFFLNTMLVPFIGFAKDTFKPRPIVEAYVNSEQHHKFENQILSLNGIDTSINYVNNINENTSVIIAEDGFNIDLTKYDKLENTIKSPIVLFAPRGALKSKENFSDGGVNNRDTLKKDLYDILIAMENYQDWKDIGISHKVISGKVSLVIPKKNSPYYNAVVETIYVALNYGNDTLTKDDVKALKVRVDAILSKCIEVEDIGRYISNKNEERNMVLDGLVLGPEFIIVENPNAYRLESYDWLPIYLDKASSVSMDIYIKSDSEFKESLKSSFTRKKMTELTGMRVENRTYELDNIVGFSSSIEVVKYADIENEAKEEIKNNISKEKKIAYLSSSRNEPVGKLEDYIAIEASKNSLVPEEEKVETETNKTEQEKENSQGQEEMFVDTENVSNEGTIIEFLNMFSGWLNLIVIVVVALMGVTVIGFMIKVIFGW